MRITKRTNIAIRVLMYCATHHHRLVTKSEIAEACNLSENHLAQVINQLGQLGFLNTQRGRNGGMSLNRSAETVRIGEVFRLIEGSLPLAECFSDADHDCEPVNARLLRHALKDAERAFYTHLDDVTLAGLVADNLEETAQAERQMAEMSA